MDHESPQVVYTKMLRKYCELVEIQTTLSLITPLPAAVFHATAAVSYSCVCIILQTLHNI